MKFLPKLLPISLKTLLALTIIFVTGVSVTLFTQSRRDSMIVSPVTLAQAADTSPLLQTNSFSKKQDQAAKKPGTIDDWFVHFDRQQHIWKNEELALLYVETQQSQPQVLGISKKKGQITIALFGDSHVDTMGTELPYLQQALTNAYPNIQFTLLNYGIGAQTVESGLKRLDDKYAYKDRVYPEIKKSQADIIIVESFAYNPMGKDKLTQYQQSLQQLIASLKKTQATVIYLASIAPLKVNFGNGAEGVNWDQNTSVAHAETIQLYMEAGLTVAESNKIPIVDAYHPSLQPNGEGIASYISSKDGIHPSPAGHQFIASLIVQKIIEHKLL